jgi:DNA phosphorothioation-associated putative methyltransferase
MATTGHVNVQTLSISHRGDANLTQQASSYLTLLKSLQLGKRLPQGIYMHESCLGSVPRPVAEAAEHARKIAGLEVGTFNVLKFASDSLKVALLHYPRFFEDGFPLLTVSWSVDLAKERVVHKEYASDANPPVLHRKETLLPPRHPARGQFEALTRQAEALGLFENVELIGRYREWNQRLARIGVREESNRLVPLDGGTARPDPSPGAVHRHRTALVRSALSTPMQALWRHGYLDGTHSIFDYGCGRGDDIRALAERSIRASGWDPHFAPEGARTEADVVNLGFVLNVIEDVNERAEALRTAFILCRRLLVVAVLLEDRTAYERNRLFRDGVLTPRGTFQKYFHQGELRQYLETCLGREPVAVAPGIFFVFRDDLEEQKFLVARQGRRRLLLSLPRPPRVSGTEARPPRPRIAGPSKWDSHKDVLDLFWQRLLDLGRPPEGDEFDRLEEMERRVGSSARVFRHLISEKGEEGQRQVDSARNAKMSDLLVYFALNLFEQRRSFSSLPESVRRDVRCFWRSYAAAQADAGALMFSIGQPERIHRACLQAEVSGSGRLVDAHALFVATRYIPQLPTVLRVLLGCAARLYGELDAIDLVKIHLESAKVSLLTYDAFEQKALPELIERVKVDLRTQEIKTFYYGESVQTQRRQLLYLKSRFVPHSFPRFAEQAAFDESLAAIKGLDLSGFGPDADSFVLALRENALTVRDFEIVPTGPRPGLL